MCRGLWDRAYGLSSLSEKHPLSCKYSFNSCPGLAGGCVHLIHRCYSALPFCPVYILPLLPPILLGMCDRFCLLRALSMHSFASSTVSKHSSIFSNTTKLLWKDGLERMQSGIRKPWKAEGLVQLWKFICKPQDIGRSRSQIATSVIPYPRHLKLLSSMLWLKLWSSSLYSSP